MLAKKYRLPIQNFVGKKGKSERSRYFLLKVFPLPAVASAKEGWFHSRFGIIISSKVFKRAVDRNRIKRQIFNFLSEIKNTSPLNDYLIIVHPEAAKLKKEELIQELSKLLHITLTSNI